MALTLAILYTLLLAILLSHAFSSSSMSELLPSICWCLLVVAPFTFMQSQFIQAYVSDQLFGVFIFAFAILGADAWIITSNKNLKSQNFSSDILLNTGRILVVTIWAIQVAHVSLMPQIPLFEILRGGTRDLFNQAILRDQSSKLLKVPLGIPYLFQISWCLLAPLAIFILLEVKRYRLATIVFFSTALYSRLTLAKGPVLILIAMVLVGITAFLSPNWRRRAFYFCGISFVITLLPLAFFFAKDPVSIFNAEALPRFEDSKATNATPSFTINDNYREIKTTDFYAKAPQWKTAANFLFYRIFLVPVEVSHRWYHYCPHIYGAHLGFYGLFPAHRRAENFQHPANLIGLWAYTSRFPKAYTESVYAYAGIDADSFGRWGRLGILITALITFFIRIGMGVFKLTGRFGEAINRCALVLLGVTLPSASLPALFVAHGIGIYLAVLILLYFFGKLQMRKPIQATIY